MIPVTKPYTPSLKKYSDIVSKSFSNEWFTNRGPLVERLEKAIIKELKTPSLICTNNGTIPLQLALKLFGTKNEIITTPFSYVATTASILWEGLNPIFVDIDPENLTIDETKIEAAITEKTSCILATHVFGNPCNVIEIEKIAKKFELNVIYDAAHCFGVGYMGRSLFNFGDVSTCSFHATKLFHTAEGGAIFVNNYENYEKLFYMHKFGHDGPENYRGIGLNAKMSELNAAMGLTILPDFDQIVRKRKEIYFLYRQHLDLDELKLFEPRENTEWNYSYVPVIFPSEERMHIVKNELENNDIWPRRYFYPSLNKLPYIEETKGMIYSEEVSKKILCLPSYHNLQEANIITICNIINSVLQ